MQKYREAVLSSKGFQPARKASTGTEVVRLLWPNLFSDTLTLSETQGFVICEGNNTCLQGCCEDPRKGSVEDLVWWKKSDFRTASATCCLRDPGEDPQLLLLLDGEGGQAASKDQAWVIECMLYNTDYSSSFYIAPCARPCAKHYTILTTVLGVKGYYYPHFTNEETEGNRAK